MNREFYHLLDVICEKDPRYQPQAYEFVMEALSFTQKKFKRQKHVTGSELLEGIKELLLNEFGPMTLTVLNYWGMSKTEDFGNIVFNLVENKVLSKTEDDSVESFKNGYDFHNTFEVEYRKNLEKRIKRMRPFQKNALS